MRNIKISVYITSYNQKKYLIEAIDSVLNQTLKPFELLIIDDCSSDGSQKLISEYASKYNFIRPVFHQNNLGITRTRNQALDLIEGDYLTYLDGDDRFLPSKLEKEYQLISENNDVMIVFSNYYLIDSDGQRIGLWAEKSKPPEGKIFKDVFCRNFPRNNIFRNELINVNALDEIKYDTNLSIYEDWEFRIRLTKNHNVYFCDKPLSEYRIHEAGLSKSNAWEHKYAIDYINEKNEKLLNDLSNVDRQIIKSKSRHFISKISEKIALYEIDKGGSTKIRAARLYLNLINNNIGNFPIKLLFRLLLPKSIYLLLKRMKKRMKLTFGSGIDFG